MNGSLYTAKTLTGVNAFAKPTGGSSSFRRLKLSTTERQAQGKRRLVFMWRCDEPTFSTSRNIMDKLVRLGTGWRLPSMSLSGWVRIPWFIHSVKGAARKPLLKRIAVFLLFDGCWAISRGYQFPGQLNGSLRGERYEQRRVVCP